jgi:colicin import membrane protein
MLSLRGSILISAGFHVLIYVAFFVLSSFGGAKAIYKPQYEVRLVDPGELSGTRKTGERQQAPKPEPVPKPEPPQPPKEKVAVPEKKPEVVTQPKEVVPKPEPEEEPKEEAKEEAREKQAADALKDVLARINKKVGKREQMLAKKGEGEASGAGGGGWGDRQKEMQYNSYLDQVYQIVRGNWNNPPDFDMNNKSIMTVVSITILADGKITDTNIEQSSGDPLFDQSVMRAILKSDPLPPPPIGIDQQTYDLGLRFFP